MNHNNKFRSWIVRNCIRLAMLFVLSSSALFAFGQGAAPAAAPVPAPATTYPSSLAYILLTVSIILMVVIFFLSKVVILSARVKAERQVASNTSNKVVTVALVTLISVNGIFANTPALPEPVQVQSVVSPYVIYLLGTVLFIELAIIFSFTSMIFRFLAFDKPAVKSSVTEKKWRWTNFLYKRNTESEIAQLDLGHNYDGIKELDNEIPAWWKWGFYASMLFAASYMFVYHIGKFAPLQQQELKVALENAEKKKGGATSIDENSVTMLSGADLEAGKTLFTKAGACASCHGDDGGGMVMGNPGIGPNLADKYWLHKGSLKDIFYSIKYGWPEKGMRSWKTDYSPVQLAQLASYVKSLQNAPIASAKDKQGELWEESADQASAVSIDSTKTK